MSSNSRIAKNTIFLYLRMIVVVLVSLYTSRVVLDVLGETDYGIYNIVGGVVVMVSFIRNAMSSATQRYMSYSLGRNDNKIGIILGNSLIAYTVMCLLILLIAETIGLWFLNTHLNIPANRYYATNIVYQLSILSFIINIFRVPFEAAVISHEKMSFYAYLSIVETALQLVVVFLLMIVPGNKLIEYALFMMLIPLGCNVAFQIYVRKKLSCKIILRIDKDLIKNLFSYSGWSMLGSISNIFANQGGNILINIFCGVTLNAAFGLASKVNAAISGLVNSFQIAFRPQIVKLYAQNEKETVEKLCFQSSKFSYLILLAIVIPVAFNINCILSIWLKEVPQFTNIFCILLLCYSLIDAIQSPLTYLITATGKIKVYEIWLSALLLMNLPLSYLFLKLGYPPSSVIWTYVGLNFISSIIRTLYIKSFMNFPSFAYVKKVVIPSLFATILSILSGYIISMYLNGSFMATLISCLAIMLSTLLISYIAAMTHGERYFINNKLAIIYKNIKNKL